MKKQEIIDKLKEGYSVNFKDDPECFYTMCDDRLYFMMAGEGSLRISFAAIGDWNDEEIDFWK